MLILVRHARPVVMAELPPESWPLSPQGEADAAELGRHLPASLTEPLVLSSPEVKALATASACFPGRAVTEEPGFAEVAKPWFDSVDELIAATAAYLDGEDLDGWESADAVTHRFDRALGGHDAIDVVAVTHGTALAVWLSRRHRLIRPFQWWTELKLPDAWVIEWGAAGPVRVGPPTVR